MKYLFLMGGSGSGKTTLAKNLAEEAPDTYHRVLEVSTRAMRDGEVQKYDYDFISDNEYDAISDNLFEKVETQFLPARYGARFSELDKDKWNIIVVSLEGFLSAFKNLKVGDKAVLLNIILDTDLDINRQDRDPLAEQRINLSVIKNLLYNNQISINGKYCFYNEIRLSKLKKIRNNKLKYIPFFEDILSETINTTVLEQIKSVGSYEELITVFMNNSFEIGANPSLLDALEIRCKTFKRSVENICNDSIEIARECNAAMFKNHI